MTSGHGRLATALSLQAAPAWPAAPLLTLLLPALACATALALALAARHWLVEPAHLTAHCDGGAPEFWCAVRFWVIQSFVHQRIGWWALALAVFALVVPNRGAALAAAALALFAGSGALVLYTAELGAPAALLAALVFVPTAQPSGSLSGHPARHPAGHPPGHHESAASSASVAQKPSA